MIGEGENEPRLVTPVPYARHRRFLVESIRPVLVYALRIRLSGAMT